MVGGLARQTLQLHLHLHLQTRQRLDKDCGYGCVCNHAHRRKSGERRDKAPHPPASVCKVSAANEHTPHVPLAVLSNAVQGGSGQALV